MYRLTAEGRIIRSLKDGEKSFSQLLDDTGLSPRWLNVKIKILTGVGLVKRNGRTYTLIGEEQASHPLIEKLIRVSSDLYADPRIIAAILVGGVPKGILSEESDLDIVVIVKEALPIQDVEWMLEDKYDVGIDLFWFTRDGFFKMLASKSTFLFGIAEGYRLLFEKGKGISEVLEFKVLYEVRSEWEYSEEAGTWFPKRRRG